MDQDLLHFADALRRESSLEGAAVVFLDRALGLASGRLGPSAALSAWMQISSGRPFVVAHTPSAAPVTGLEATGEAFWALMGQRRAALGVDLRRGRAWQSPGERGADWRPEERLGGEGTHLLMVPLYSAGSRLDGVVGLVTHSPGRGPFERAFPELSAELQALCDLFAPTLSLLPRRGSRPLDDLGPWLPVVGRSMAPVVATLDAYARLDEILLLRGPTGTGKSRLATWCWSRSPRAAGRFVVANLLGVPESAQESELFGVRKGTFTGVGERPGQIPSAEGGTLFLDEIDKLSLATQAKILRLLDERRYRVLGDAVEREANVRFIIASNADLEALVQSGKLLEDLYYRVNVLPVRVPPLRQRQDEIAPWALWMARNLHQGRVGNDGVDFSPLALDFLCDQPWPGNLRQLHNVVRRAYALGAMAGLERLGPGELPGEILIGREMVERALKDEPELGDQPGEGDLEALRRTALGVVRLVERRRAAGLPPLSERDGDLELADAFRGLVLSIAVERTGDLRRAFELFGLGARLRGGNHLRTWRQAEDQVALLSQALAEEGRGR